VQLLRRLRSSGDGMRLRTFHDRLRELHAGILAMGQGTHERQVIEAQPEAPGHDLVLRSSGEETMTKPEDFTPTVLAPGFGVVMVATETCAACMRTMIRTGTGAGFPAFWRAGRVEQMKRAGWAERAYATNASDKPLCKDCAPTAGAFRCALCKQERHGVAEDSYGDPAEHLCTPCYETVPAKVWDEKDRELQKAHRYDFE